MNQITRNALVHIDRILTEAGWSEPASNPEAHRVRPEPTDAELAGIRHSYEALLRQDHFQILQGTFDKKLSVIQAGQLMGLDAEESRRLFHEALERLKDFVETYDDSAHGSSDSSKRVGSEIT